LIDRSEDFIIQTSVVIWKFEAHELVLGSTASSMTGFIVIKVNNDNKTSFKGIKKKLKKKPLEC
jgi:hypothetical protein